VCQFLGDAAAATHARLDVLARAAVDGNVRGFILKRKRLKKKNDVFFLVKKMFLN